MKTIYLSAIFTFLSFGLFSQVTTIKIEDSGITPAYKTSGDGNVNITQDIKVLQIIKRHKELNNNKFHGWRVQVYFGSGQSAMSEAQSAKKRFLTRYGHTHGAYIIYDSPFYKIRVGDFRTKAEALKFKEQIKKTFPESWIKQDRINYPVENN